LDEIDKVLVDGGYYILISFGEPDLREKYLKREKWKFKVTEIPMLDLRPPKKDPPKNSRTTKKKRRRKKKVVEEKKVFYLYICQKGGAMDLVEEDSVEDENEAGMVEK
jgi:hypothetical protein